MEPHEKKTFLKRGNGVGGGKKGGPEKPLGNMENEDD